MTAKPAHERGALGMGRDSLRFLWNLSPWKLAQAWPPEAQLNLVPRSRVTWLRPDCHSAPRALLCGATFGSSVPARPCICSERPPLVSLLLYWTGTEVAGTVALGESLILNMEAGFHLPSDPNLVFILPDTQ